MFEGKYRNDILKAHDALYLKSFSKEQFEKALVKELKVSKTYGKCAYLIVSYQYGEEVNVMYNIFGLKNNELVFIGATVNSITRENVKYGSRLINTNAIQMKPICKKTQKNNILFEVLDKCKDGVISNIHATEKSATVTFDFANRDSIKLICDKYDNVTYNNLPSISKKQCVVKIKFDKPINEHTDIFNFDFK